MPSTTRTATTGGIAGIAAFVAGYLATYLYRGQEIREALGGINWFAELVGSDPIPAWKVVGWLFFNAHYVSTKVQAGPIGPRFANFIQGSDANLALLYVFPPVILLVAGFLVAFTLEDSDPVDVVKSAGMVTAGYALAAAAGTVVFRVGASGPDVVPAILVAGILYPAVFASIGGLLVLLPERLGR